MLLHTTPPATSRCSGTASTSGRAQPAASGQSLAPLPPHHRCAAHGAAAGVALHVAQQPRHQHRRRGVTTVARSIADGHDPSRLQDCNVLELETFLRVYKERSAGSSSSSASSPPLPPPGEVYLVGTGPGDPGLLTLRAAQLMASADVVLYDRLVSDEILRLVGPSARMVYVGKTAGYHTRRQEEIHELLLAFAEAGARVVRLKGGDPYVFGRGGEEVQYLSAHGIRVHCVPGITAASGICAELGVPLTHRGVATSVRFLTGHTREGAEDTLDDALALSADPNTTLIVYMGLQTLPKLTQQLLAGGMPASLPAVAVERGTTPSRRVVYGTAAELHGLATAAALKTPTLIILGEVVALSPGWQAWQAAGRPLEWNDASPYPELQLELSLGTGAAAGPRSPAAAAAAAAGVQGQQQLVGAGGGSGRRGSPAAVPT